jgi:hypothetical protein
MAIPERNDHSNIWRRQRRAVVSDGRWRDLDYGNLTNAIRDIVEAMTVDCTLAVHSGVESMHVYIYIIYIYCNSVITDLYIPYRSL